MGTSEKAGAGCLGCWESRSACRSAGIGLACAEVLGAAGAKVVIADINADSVREAEQRLQQQGVEVAACQCDVGDKAQVQRLVTEAVQRFGGVDAMVCNAAVLRTADFLELEEEDWDVVMRVNLKGVFLVGSRAGRRAGGREKAGAPRDAGEPQHSSGRAQAFDKWDGGWGDLCCIDRTRAMEHSARKLGGSASGGGCSNS